MFKQLIGTASITITNVSDGKDIIVMYSVTGNLLEDGSPDLEFWHNPPSRKGDIYMIQKVGDGPWSAPIRMEGIPGISFKMQGSWKYAQNYKGGLEAPQTDLVMYDGATWACIKEHTSPADENDAIVNAEKLPLSSAEVEEFRESMKEGDTVDIQTQYWLLTSMAGMQGPIGPAGNSGESSLTVILSNESHSFISNSAGEITSASANSTKTDIVAYLGTERIEVTSVEFIKPQGLQVSIARAPDTELGRNVITGLTITAEPGSFLSQSGLLEMTVKARKNTDSAELSVVKGFSWSKIRDGESPYFVEVTSSKGLVFKKGSTNTTLKATILYGAQDVTGEMQGALRWYKVLEDGTEQLWRGTEGKREISITASDVIGSATFFCEIEIE